MTKVPLPSDVPSKTLSQSSPVLPAGVMLVDEVFAVLENLLGGLGVPILWDLGFGHCEAQRTVPLGVAAELDADAQRLSILQPALR